MPSRIKSPSPLGRDLGWGYIKVFKCVCPVDINRNLFKGLGKPEPLKGNLSGCWSRRITDEHRLIYKVDKDIIYIFSCHGHYKK